MERDQVADFKQEPFHFERHHIKSRFRDVTMSWRWSFLIHFNVWRLPGEAACALDGHRVPQLQRVHDQERRVRTFTCSNTKHQIQQSTAAPSSTTVTQQTFRVLPLCWSSCNFNLTQTIESAAEVLIMHTANGPARTKQQIIPLSLQGW